MSFFLLYYISWQFPSSITMDTDLDWRLQLGKSMLAEQSPSKGSVLEFQISHCSSLFRTIRHRVEKHVSALKQDFILQCLIYNCLQLFICKSTFIGWVHDRESPCSFKKEINLLKFIKQLRCLILFSCVFDSYLRVRGGINEVNMQLFIKNLIVFCWGTFSHSFPSH